MVTVLHRAAPAPLSYSPCSPDTRLQHRIRVTVQDSNLISINKTSQKDHENICSLCIPTTLQTHVNIADQQQEAGQSVVFPNQSEPGRGQQQASLELGTEAGAGRGGATDRGLQQTVLLVFTTLVILSRRK